VVAHVHSAQTPRRLHTSSLAALTRRGLLTRYRHRTSGRYTYVAGSDQPDADTWEQVDS